MPHFKRSLITMFMFAAVLAGAGCNGFKEGEPARPGERLAKWLDERTPQEMQQVYREGVAMLSQTMPDKSLYAQMSFVKEQTAADVLKLLANYPDIQVAAIYFARGGETRVDNLSGDKLRERFDEEYQSSLTNLARVVAEEENWCRTESKWCNATSSKRYADLLAHEQKNGQLTVAALGIYGPAKTFQKMWTEASSPIFIIQPEDGYVVGMPLYPNTNMKSWW